MKDDCRVYHGKYPVLIRQLREENPVAFHGFLTTDVETFYHLLQMVKGAYFML